MGVAKQLYHLQEIDLEIESDESQMSQKVSQLGESNTIINLRNKLTSEQKLLNDSAHQQRSAEWEIDDLTGKIATAEGQLYSGRITNPKELSSLQQEINAFKAKRDQIENKALEIIDHVELAETNVAATGNEIKKLEGEWHNWQQQLSAEIEQLKGKLSELKQKRQLLTDAIDPQTVDLYEHIRKQKGQAVARVEQGICRGCRISLSSNELQQARSGNLIQCGSCGRILFLP
ncbi:zinc ribbon domain-containing protein [Chloroflexota bacterium]